MKKISGCKICNEGIGLPKNQYPSSPGFLIEVVDDNQYIVDCKCTIQLRFEVFIKNLLLVKGFDGPSPLIGKTDQHMLISGPDTVVLSHVKTGVAASWAANQKFRFNLITDAELIEANFFKAPSLDSDAALHDTSKYSIEFISYTPNLVVVQMGIQTKRNGMAPEIFLQFLRTRLTKNLPTWILEANTKFDAGHKLYNSMTQELLSSKLEFLDLGVANLTSNPKIISYQKSNYQPMDPEARKALSRQYETQRDIEEVTANTPGITKGIPGIG